VNTVASVRSSRRRGILAGVAASLLLMTTAFATLSGFTATVVNPTNTFSSSTLILKETQGATNCDSTGATSTVTVANSYNCTTINVLGGGANAAPGSTVTTSTIVIKNDGTLNAATFTLTPAACTAAANAATTPYAGAGTATFCSHVNVTVENTTGTACLWPVAATACPALANTTNLSTLGSHAAFSIGTLAAGASTTLTIKTQLDAAVATNADQGLTAQMQFTWALGQ
jgi:hypothetical protein